MKCFSCDSNVVKGRIRCKGCLIKANHAQKRFRRKLTENHLCPRCKIPVSASVVYCEKCKEVNRRRANNRNVNSRKNNKCISCGKDSRGSLTYCGNCALKHKENQYNYYKKIKVEVFEHYGSTCACCGESELVFLTLDHINNNGAKHRREIGNAGGVNFYFWLKKHNYPDVGIQTLCYNCNMGKRVTRGACPHKVLQTKGYLQ